jgi:hypothetical protein
MRDEHAPERYPFTKPSNLIGRIGCADDTTLRKIVMRCRNKLKQLAANAGDPPPSIDAVLENIPWHGYRLNPNRVRIVALSDVAFDARPPANNPE